MVRAEAGHPHADCGCRSEALFLYTACCDDCGFETTGEVVVPTSGQVGDEVEIGVLCSCGSDAFGLAVVVEVWPSAG